MNDPANLPHVIPRWRIGHIAVSWSTLASWTVALGLASFALSAITVTARSQLWLGPQTVILGSVGLCVGVTIALLAQQFARACGAELFDRPLLSRRGMCAVIIACATVTSVILYLAFACFPNSADEYGFLFQAKTFGHFRLWNSPPPDPELFNQNYIIARGGIWISQYLPGWPAILAMFQLADLPSWLAAPVCGALLVLLLWTGLSLECRSPALTVALLLAYASSDFFLLNSATYFSHCASALAVVGSIVCMLHAERDTSWWWPASAGACFGFALLCRIDSAALAGATVFAGWIEQRCRRRTLILGIGGAAPLAVVFAGYNWLVTGNPLLPPTAWAGEISFGANGLQGVEATPLHFRMLVQTLWRLGELADTASLVVPTLYLVALGTRFRASRLRFYDVVPVANFALFLIFPDVGGFQMGPRYWFDGFIAMHLTLGSEFSQQSPAWRRFAVACCLLLTPVSLARLPAQVAFEAHVMHERSSVFRLGSALPQDRRSVVLLTDFPSAWNHRANRTAPNLAKDFARNGTQLDKPVLYARGDVPGALERGCALYPEAAFYIFRLDRAHPNGWLEPLTCTPSKVH